MPVESWPFEEADRILARTASPDHRIVLETGFGPSGLPHIGTLGEALRTSFIVKALEDRGARDVHLTVFSDDMDGLRKVPLNVPGDLSEHLGRPVSRIPDPWGCCASYSGHMNSKLVAMLERFEVPYEFRSSDAQYGSGVFDDGLVRMLEKVDEVRAVILPTLSADHQRDWSPFLPICENCGRLYTTRVTSHDAARHTLDYACDRPMGTTAPCGQTGRLPVTGGRVKAGWKPDWALRWFTFRVDYEMYGKDLIESAVLARRILRVLGRQPPIDYFYELFLDEDGSKISKSIGRGVTVDTWLAYAPRESLALFMLRNPRRAKRLSLGVIGHVADEYLEEVRQHFAARQPPPEGREARPGGDPTSRSSYGLLARSLPESPPYPPGLSYGMLTNLAATIGQPSADLVASYVRRSVGWPDGDDRAIRELIGGAITYYRDVLHAQRVVHTLTPAERPAVAALETYLTTDHAAEEIQTRTFAIARETGLEPKDLFRCLYLVLTGQERGPRLGTFVKVLGQDHARRLLCESLSRDPGEPG